MSEHTLSLSALTLEGGDFVNPRDLIVKARINELADSIEQHGLQQPLVVWQTKAPKGKKPLNVVVDGGRRYRALELLKSEKRDAGLCRAVPVTWSMASTLAEALVAALVGNLQREELTSFETAKAISALKADHGIDQRSIAEMISKSPTWVSRKMATFRNASPELLKAWKERKVSDEIVENVASIKGPDKKADHAAQDIILGKVYQIMEEDKGNPTREGRAVARNIAKSAGAKENKGAKESKKSSGAKENKGAKEGSTKKPKFTEGMIAAFINNTDLCPKKNRYVHGLRDAFRLIQGDIGVGELAKEWEQYSRPATKLKVA